MKASTTSYVRADVREKGVRVFVSISGTPRAATISEVERAAERSARALARAMATAKRGAR